MKTKNWAWVSILFGFALCLSLIVNFVLLRKVREFYGAKLLQQLWPAGIPQSAIRRAVTNPKHTVLLIGDSRIAEWGLPSLDDCTVINAGVNGITTSQLRLRMAALLDEHHPDVAVIQVGINDLKILGLRPELSESVINLCASNIVAMARECESRNIKVIVTEIWPVGEIEIARRFVWGPAVTNALAHINLQLTLVSSPDKNIRVVNLFQETANENKEPTRRGWYRDALHLKPEAYDLLTSALKKQLAP